MKHALLRRLASCTRLQLRLVHVAGRDERLFDGAVADVTVSNLQGITAAFNNTYADHSISGLLLWFSSA